MSLTRTFKFARRVKDEKGVDVAKRLMEATLVLSMNRHAVEDESCGFALRIWAVLDGLGATSEEDVKRIQRPPRQCHGYERLEFKAQICRCIVRVTLWKAKKGNMVPSGVERSRAKLDELIVR